MQRGDSATVSAGDSDIRPNDSMVLRVASVASVLAAAFFVGTAVIGAIRWSHPIPYWDMWDGYLSFWFELQDGNNAIWWELSNEHHLVLLKAIFWLDLSLFGGSEVFLVAVNFLITAGIAMALILLLHERLTFDASSRPSRSVFVTLSSALVMVSFSWMQGEELVFPYHAHFLLTVFVALLAFGTLGISANRVHQQRTGANLYFGLAFAAALLAPWTSASGLFLPFLAAALAAFIGLGRVRSLSFVVLGVLSAIVYTINSPFLQTDGDGPIANLIASPIEVLRFWFIYIGGPWAVVTDSQWIGGAAGLIFAIVVIFLTVHAVRRRRHSKAVLVVLAYPIFMVVSSGVTAAGRINLGIEQVTAIRYLTPMLAGWACLLVLAAPRLQLWFTRTAPVALLGLVVLPALLLPEQISALTPKYVNAHMRDTAALAISLGAPDALAIIPVYPFSTERPIELGSRARVEGVGLFSRDPYASLQATLNVPVPTKDAATCVGWLESRVPLENSSWDRIDGWVVVEGIPLTGGVLTLTDRMAQTVGWVAIGKPREDVRAQNPAASGLNGYSGYLDSSAASGDVFIAGDSFRCSEPLSSSVP